VSDSFCIRGDSTEEIADEAVDVVARLDARRVRSREQHGTAAEERLDVRGHITECAPNDGRYA
jgi:hypothetical protein